MKTAVYSDTETMPKEIESEVFQRKFRNEYHKAVVNLVYTFNYVSTELQHIFGREGLTMQQFNILRILRGRHPEPCTNSFIKERMLDKNSDVTRIVDRLIKSGLVERGYCQKDRRRVEICITDEGLKLLKRLDECTKSEDAILENLNESEVARLNELLDKVRG